MENPSFLTRICMDAYLFSLPFPSLCGVFRPAPLGFRQDLSQLCKKTAWVLFLIPNRLGEHWLSFLAAGGVVYKSDPPPNPRLRQGLGRCAPMGGACDRRYFLCLSQKIAWVLFLIPVSRSICRESGKWRSSPQHP